MRSFPKDWEAECIIGSERVNVTLTLVLIFCFIPPFSMEYSFVSIGGKHN